MKSGGLVCVNWKKIKQFLLLCNDSAIYIRLDCQLLLGKMSPCSTPLGGGGGGRN